MAKSLIEVNHLSKTIGGRRLFDDVSFRIRKNDCIGLLGPNGCGKTTLLKLLLGRMKPEEGEVLIGEGVNIRYLEQVSIPDESETVSAFLARFCQPESVSSRLEELNEKLSDPLIYSNGEYEHVFEQLTKLKLEVAKAEDGSRVGKALDILEEMGSTISREEKMKTLSGGERQKVALAGVLSEPFDCDVLLLDEPTNHLDIETIEWLEEELAAFPAALLIVTHDRYLLDDLANRMLEFRGQSVDVYHADFEGYMAQRALRMHIRKKEFLKAKAEEKRYLESLEKMNRRNRFDSQIKKKQKQLSKVSVPKDPVLDEYLMRFHIDSVFKSGKNIADGKGLSKSYGKKTLLDNASFEIFSGQKIGLVGSNGCGKTTFLKALVKRIPLDEGKIHISLGARWRYFDQGNLSLVEQNTLVDEVLRDHPDLDENDAKSLLGRFDFEGKKIYSKVEVLSGGERARLAFLRLVMEPLNFLVLDEPTNHMDVYSKEAIEDALLRFQGTVLVVSHDRHFLDKICDHMLWMADGSLHMYKGNFSVSKSQRAMELIHSDEKNPSQMAIAGMNVRRYVVKKVFTEWKSRRKFSVGEEVYIGDHNRELFEWALESGRLVEKSRRKKR